MINSYIGKIKNLSGKKFVKDVFILQCGSFVSIGFSAITSVIFARLLGVNNYGIYALIFAFVDLINIFMDVGAGYAVLTLLPAAYAKEDKQEIKNILSYFIYIVLFISSTIGLFALLVAPYLTNLIYQSFEIGYLARYIILAAIVRILFSMLILILQAIRRIKFLTTVENIDKFVYLLIPASLVVFGYGLWGIVFGHFISSLFFFIFSWLILSWLTKKDRLLPSLFEILKNFRQVKFGKYFKFGFLISLNKNIGNLYSILPVVFLGMFAATTSQVAYFKIANSYLGLALIFMTAISRILLVQLPKSLVYGKEIFKDNLKKVSLISGFIFVFLLFFFLLTARYLVLFFYGQKYLPTIRLIYVLSPSYVLLGFAVGFSSFFRTLDKLRPLLLINLFVIASGGLLFIFLKQIVTPLESVILLYIYYSLSATIGQGLYVIRYFKKAKNSKTLCL